MCSTQICGRTRNQNSRAWTRAREREKCKAIKYSKKRDVPTRGKQIGGRMVFMNLLISGTISIF